MQQIEAGAHALLISTEGKVLLVAKGGAYTYDRRNAGKIGMFGGRVEPGEDARTALLRELREELGLDLGAEEAVVLGMYRKTVEQDGADVDVHVFLVRDVRADALAIRSEAPGSGENLDVNERTVEGTPDEILALPNLTRITRLAVEEYARQAPAPRVGGG